MVEVGAGVEVEATTEVGVIADGEGDGIDNLMAMLAPLLPLPPLRPLTELAESRMTL